jgi:large subunit ribosomal protein L18
MAKLTSKERRKKKHRRVRKKISGRPSKPRFCVFKSNKHIYAQVVDDFTNRVLVGASSLSSEVKEKFERGNCEAAHEVGRLTSERAQEMGIEEVVFDRGGYRYHGRIAAVAEGAREAGLQF